MDSKKAFLNLERIESVVQLDPAIFILFLAITAWLLYRLFLKDLSKKRQQNLNGLFKNLLWHSVAATVLFVSFDVLISLGPKPLLLERLTPYIGLFSILWGCLVLIKTSRIFLFEYLFLFNMQVGVPLLLVNLFTLIISVFIGSWVLSSVFQFEVVSLVATSAVLSIVLGLALQDTLGNLFSGVALQLDKPYIIGDWVEIINGTQKVTGQVQEVSWRATVLLSITEEIITLPNRWVAQSQVSNFSGKTGPVIRSQAFRIPYDADMKKVRSALLASLKGIKGVLQSPPATVFVNESADSWLVVKLIYYVEDFGQQFRIADEVISAAVESLHESKISPANPRITVLKEAA